MSVESLFASLGDWWGLIRLYIFCLSLYLPMLYLNYNFEKQFPYTSLPSFPQLPPQHLESRYLLQQPSQQPSYPSINDMSTLELPHSCSNGNDDQFEIPPINAPHTWLCDDTLLCLLDVRHEQNMPAFQERWMRGQVRPHSRLSCPKIITCPLEEELFARGQSERLGMRFAMLCSQASPFMAQ